MTITITTTTNPLPQSELERFLPSPRAVRAFEDMQTDVTETIPEAVEQIVDLTNQLLAAPYIAWEASGTLENERVINAGQGIAVGVGLSLASISITNTGVSSGLYGSASKTVSFSVDAMGRITSASEHDLNTTNITEGTNLYFTDARARGAISASGSLGYDSGTGVISYTTPDSDGIAEGVTNLYFTDARAQDALEFDQGTWTPTLTNGANVDASTAFLCHYSRIGDQVHCWGQVNIDPTAAANTLTQVDMSLPIASNFSAGTDLRGMGAAHDVQRAAFIDPDTTNDRARFRFFSEVTGNTTFSFEFDYEVIA